MNARILFLISIAAITLNGCATQESFRKMDTASRVSLVCNQDKSVSAATADLKFHQRRITEITTELERGYQVHNSCKTIEVEEELPVSCRKFDPQSKQYTECSRERKKTQKRVCSDQIVQLNVSLAKENLHRHQDQRDDAQHRKDHAYRSCQDKVQGMNPDQAYQYYMSL